MYPVSQAFMEAIESNTRKYYWTGTIVTKNKKEYAFSNEDIVKGSGYISRQCCGSNEIELGSVYASEMGITLFLDIDRYTLEEAEVRLYYHLVLADKTEECIPMGVFEVSEANRNIKTLELKAYDHMLRFEKNLKLASSSGTPYQFIKACCDACKVEMAQSVSEIGGMPNGKATLGIYSDNDIETFRDLLFYVTQVLGGFCQIDRFGRLEILQYEKSVALTVSQNQRFDSSYSDFVTRYTAISSTNLISQKSEYVAVQTDDALTMNLGINPLLQFGLKATREKILREILNALQKVEYVPFDSTTIGNPALDIGDILTFCGGHADEKKLSCITSITCKIGGKMSLKCVGKNPRLAGAKSKNDKNISGLLNTVESGKTVIYSFVNVSPFAIENRLTDVMDIDFTATEDTSASFQCEMLLEVIKTNESAEEYPTLTVVYKLNDETVDGFMPTKTCLYGKHIVTLFFPISKVIENSSNTFSMYLKIDGGGITIGEAQIRATISGQGLAAGLGDWNGRISINEDISFVPICVKPFLVDSFNDNAEIVFNPKNMQAITQTIGNISIAHGNFGIDLFSDKTMITEILRIFELTSVRGNPHYNGYVEVNSNEQFVLCRTYAINSQPQSADVGFTEKLVVDTSFLESADSIEICGRTSKYRKQLVINTLSADVFVSDKIETENMRFELMTVRQEEQFSVTEETDDGFMECLTIDTSSFDGVKGVVFEA